MAGPSGTVAFFVLSFVTFFVSCFLLGFSFDSLEPGVMALMFDRNTRYLDCTTLYGAERDGSSRRFFTGLGRGFYEFRFPMALSRIEFSDDPTATGPVIDAKTVDGVTVSVSLSVQYQLNKDPAQLCKAYYAFAGNPNAYYAQYLRAAARDAVSRFALTDLWTYRAAVGSAINASVVPEINSRWSTTVGFQLLSLDIPETLQTAIENTTVQAQGILQAQLNLQAQTVSAITRRDQAFLAAQATVISAQAQAQAVGQLAVTAAQALNLTFSSEALGYRAWKAAHGMDNSQVLALAWLDAVSRAPVDKVLLSVDTPASTHAV